MTIERKQPKPKTCKNPACRASFVPQRLGQAVCSPKCALATVEVQKAKEKKSLAQAGRREFKVRKEALKSRGDHLKDAEKAVRDYRRTYELSIGSGCISCGESQESILAGQL
ncbi:recombination protein NinG [Pseudomonas iridis]|uniref:recombination protein NinG n=1 Tax=Pseudomonas iridis TaxID=2710587 RepID=UPI001B3275C6|nr:recombination protein NinG [Pseudomonas iridis]MBP5969445.1 recombination protein NinG [Pseudomonas iridis]